MDDWKDNNGEDSLVNCRVAIRVSGSNAKVLLFSPKGTAEKLLGEGTGAGLLSRNITRRGSRYALCYEEDCVCMCRCVKESQHILCYCPCWCL